ncbi:MAG: ATP-binding protein [Lachnospiraceae bacterium]|nr:ATP-binding protein [Lachnospiraceae bacterium]
MALNNTQYESIMRGYEHTRDRNRHTLELRRAQAYASIPQLEDLDRSVGSIATAKARLLLAGDDSAMKHLHTSLQEISQKRTSLLSEAGFPADYLEPIYDCPACKDTGYLQKEDGSREKCSCFRRQEIAYLYEQSNIQDMIAKENFSTLSYKYYQGEDLERFQKAVKICEDFVQNFKQDYHNLFFYGTVGTGKSFLSGCIACELLKSGCSVIYFSASALFDTLARYAFDAKEKDALSCFYKDLYNCDLLIIDDLGTEVTNTFVTSQLFSCLNERHMRRHSTVISTNLSLEELRDRYSDRVFSRITSNYAVCKLTGPDIRMYKKRAANTPNS